MLSHQLAQHAAATGVSTAATAAAAADGELGTRMFLSPFSKCGRLCREAGRTLLLHLAASGLAPCKLTRCTSSS